MATRMRTRTKRPTPLSTRSLAAFLTWKQFDLLLLLAQNSPQTTRAISEDMPKEDGKLKINLGEQITGDDDHGRPDEGGEPSEEERQTQRRERATRLSGRPIDRAAVRAKRYGIATIGGGGE